MKRFVYVIFKDHRDWTRPTCECDMDYYHDFQAVVGTKNEARGLIQDLLLAEYYHYLDESGEIVPDPYGGYDYLDFTLLEDCFDKIMVDIEGDVDAWYFEEFEINIGTEGS